MHLLDKKYNYDCMNNAVFLNIYNFSFVYRLIKQQFGVGLIYLRIEMFL